MANSLKPIPLTAATTLNRNTHADTVVVMNSATGFTITLPASAGKGDIYRVFVNTTATSGSHVVAALGADIIQGSVAIAGDIAGVTCPTTATSDKITMNGGTTGGIKGSYLELRDLASGVWMVTGSLVSTSSEATPFSET